MNGRTGIRISVCLIIMVSSMVSLAGPQSKVLGSAWEEYWLQNFATAKKMFLSVIKSGGASQSEIIQAKLGRAMIVNYQMPGGNPAKAIPLYKDLIKEIGDGNPLKAQVQVLIARAFSDKPETRDSAIAYLAGVITSYPETNSAREAILETAYLRLGKYDLDEIKDIIAFLEKDLEKYPSNPYAGTMHAICGYLAIEVLRDFEIGRKHLMAWYEAGIANLTNEPIVLYQIARLSEEMKDDPDVAAKYYKLLADNHPTDVRAYISRLAAERLQGQGNEK